MFVFGVLFFSFFVYILSAEHILVDSENKIDSLLWSVSWYLWAQTYWGQSGRGGKGRVMEDRQLPGKFLEQDETGE